MSESGFAQGPCSPMPRPVIPAHWEAPRGRDPLLPERQQAEPTEPQSEHEADVHDDSQGHELQDAGRSVKEEVERESGNLWETDILRSVPVLSKEDKDEQLSEEL
eukprot:Skav213632  [mRNA]  locus=scaffold2012:27373:28873:+ [translate_table: standard]